MTLGVNTAKNIAYYLKKKIEVKVVKNSISYKKTQYAHMSISSRRRAVGLERLPYLKYNVLKWENTLTLRLNAAKNIDYIKKALNKS